MFIASAPGVYYMQEHTSVGRQTPVAKIVKLSFYLKITLLCEKISSVTRDLTDYFLVGFMKAEFYFK